MIGAIFLLLLIHIQHMIVRPLFALIYFLKPPRLPPITNSLLKESATMLAENIRNGQLSSQEVVQAFIDRIKEVNPFLNAVVEDRFEEALEDAKMCDAMLKSGKVTAAMLEKEKPLFGVPITVKESLSLKGMSCAGGNLAHKGRKAQTNSVVVDLMLNAGAIALCVTNTSELCSSIHSTNVLTGSSKNPYDTRMSPGGSSGGEGALLGAGASVLGIGSDFVGSVRLPSHFNGIFGHKPSTDIVSNEGHFPNSNDPTFIKMLTIGPMVKYAKDLRLVLKVLSSKYESPLGLDVPVVFKTIKVLYIHHIEAMCGIYSTTLDIKEKIEDATRHLAGLGAHVEEMSQDLLNKMHVFFAVIPSQITMPVEYQIPEGDTKTPIIIEYFKALMGLSKYTAQLSITRLLMFQKVVSRTDLMKLKDERELLLRKIHNLLDDNTVIIMPTFVQPTSYPECISLNVHCAVYTAVANMMEIPATHVPMGLNKDGLPIGLQVLAGPKQDRLCLAVAEELETKFGGWVPPPV